MRLVSLGVAPPANTPQCTGTTTAGTRLTAYWARRTSNSMPSPTVGTAPVNHVVAQLLTYGGVKATAGISVGATGAAAP